MTRDPATNATPRPRILDSLDLPMLLLVFFWGLNYSVMKLALTALTPLAFNAIRFTMGTAMMAAIMWLRGDSWQVSRRDLLHIFLLGFVGQAIYQLIFINGLARTTSANASLLLGTSPIFVSLWGLALRIERISLVTWLGIIISFVGITLVVAGGPGGINLGNNTIAGDLLILLGTLVWGIYTTALRPLVTRLAPVKVTTLSMLASTPALILFATRDLLTLRWAAVPANVWAATAFSGCVAIAFGYIIWNNGVRRRGNAATAIYQDGVPVVAILIGVLFLGEHYALLQAVGAVVVLAGIIITQHRKAAPAAPAPEPSAPAPEPVEGPVLRHGSAPVVVAGPEPAEGRLVRRG